MGNYLFSLLLDWDFQKWPVFNQMAYSLSLTGKSKKAKRKKRNLSDFSFLLLTSYCLVFTFYFLLFTLLNVN